MDRIGPREPPRHYLREWREEKGLTQQTLADRMDTGKDTVSRYENGKRRMTLEMAAAFAYALDPEMDAVMLFRDPARPTRDELLRDLSEDEVSEVLDFADYVRQKRKAS